MFSFRTTPIEQQDDLVLSHGKLGLLCNQSAWHADTGEYLFDILKKRGNLKRIFMPEHGLFAEQQDQVKIADGICTADLQMMGQILSHCMAIQKIH